MNRATGGVSGDMNRVTGGVSGDMNRATGGVSGDMNRVTGGVSPRDSNRAAVMRSRQGIVAGSPWRIPRLGK